MNILNQKNSSLDFKSVTRHHVTPWVALVIIGAFAVTVGVLIWNNAHESWQDTSFPQFQKRVSTLINRLGTTTWKTYSDSQYGFTLRHPLAYQKTAGDIVTSSILSSAGNTVQGTSVGPLIFVKLEDPALRAAANATFETYWNSAGPNESTDNYCIKRTVENGNLDIRTAFCVSKAKGTIANYALIKGNTFDVFVDGYSWKNDSKLFAAYSKLGKSIPQAEVVEILSTFQFIKN